MKRQRRTAIFTVGILFATIAMGLILTVQNTSDASGSADALVWNDFDLGMSLARDSNKKILIDVYTDWCSWCKKMDSEVYTDKGVIEAIKASYVLVKLNAESQEQLTYQGKRLTEREFAGSVGVSGYPSTLFFESSGKPITLVPGYIPAMKFTPILRYIGENHYQSVSYEDYLKSSEQTLR